MPSRTIPVGRDFDLASDVPNMRPGEVIGDASRLQKQGHVLPSAESSDSRNLDEKRVNIRSYTLMALLVLFAVFVFIIIFVLE